MGEPVHHLLTPQLRDKQREDVSNVCNVLVFKDQVYFLVGAGITNISLPRIQIIKLKSGLKVKHIELEEQEHILGTEVLVETPVQHRLEYMGVQTADINPPRFSQVDQPCQYLHIFHLDRLGNRALDEL